jgi:hypothetical protein
LGDNWSSIPDSEGLALQEGEGRDDREERDDHKERHDSEEAEGKDVVGDILIGLDKNLGEVVEEKDTDDESLSELERACEEGSDPIAEMSFAEMSFAEMSFAEMSFAEMSFAEMSFAEMSFAEMEEKLKEVVKKRKELEDESSRSSPDRPPVPIKPSRLEGRKIVRGLLPPAPIPPKLAASVSKDIPELPQSPQTPRKKALLAREKAEKEARQRETRLPRQPVFLNTIRIFNRMVWQRVCRFFSFLLFPLSQSYFAPLRRTPV